MEGGDLFERTSDDLAMRIGRRRRDERPTPAIDPTPGPDDLVFSLAGTLQSPEAGAKLLATSVSFDQTPMSLWEAKDNYLVAYGLDSLHVVAIKAVTAAFPTIQSLPDERVLICGPGVADGSTNAWIFSSGGELQIEANIGDGFEQVLTTPAGSIWVGYLDEGVFGGSDPAHHGIVRFDDSLTPVWKYPLSSSHGAVEDCYALNVDGESALSCFFSHFPIVRISGDHMSGWTGAPTGANGLLSAGESALLFGGYSDERKRVVRLHLKADGSTKQIGRGVIRGLPSDLPVAPLCRGPEAHVFIGANWYRASI